MIKNKIQGCLIGGAIGDALGYQIEFKRGILEKQVIRFKDDFGIISDDTQMTLFAAVSLMRYAAITNMCPQYPINPIRDIFEGYLDWLDTQKGTTKHTSTSWIKAIPELNQRRAPGNTCLSSLSKGRMGTFESPINNSKGCGSVMRVSPCGIFENDPEKAGLLAAKSAAITHGNKLAWISSFVCASMINMLIYNDLSIEKALLDTLRLLESKEKLFYEKPNYLFSMTPISNFMKSIDNAIYFSKDNMLDSEAIRLLGEGWNAEEALSISIYACLKYQNSFENSVVCAINHDGDSDSTGAIAGNIIGASLGLKTIPTYYSDNIELRDLILDIANDMWLYKSDQFYTTQGLIDNWKHKYIDCKM